jgi:phosphoglycerol transferase MdoB-like AlkP superfamily enzyme
LTSKSKKIRLIISISGVALLLALLFANIAFFWNTDKNACIGESSRTQGTLTEETPFRQYFVPEREKLSFVEVRMKKYTSEQAAGTIHFSLMDSKDRVLHQQDVLIEDLEVDSFFRFNTDLVLDTEETYSFVLLATDTGWGKAPVVWISLQSGQEESALTLPGTSPSSTYQTNARYGYTYFHVEAFVGCAILIILSGLAIFLKPKMSECTNKMAGIAALLCTPVIMFFLAEALNDNSAMDKAAKVYPLNYILYLLMYLITFVIINRLRISMIFTNTLIYFLAVVNYFKLQFRGEPLEPWDIFSAKTAMNVSSGYQFSLSIVLIYTFFFFLLLNLLIAKIDFSMKKIRSRILLGSLSTAVSVFMVMSLFGTDRYAVAAFGFLQKWGITNNVWNQSSNYQENGLVVAFTMNAQFVNVDKPDGYSTGTVAELKDIIEYGSVENANVIRAQLAANPTPSSVPTPEITDSVAPTPEITVTATPTPEIKISATPVPELPGTLPTVTDLSQITQTTVSKPNVIAIMCESYADLTTVGDFVTNEAVTPFIDGLSNNTIKGTLYVSTYGGGTANTEFEFLTGNSMAFLPNGSIPYQQYISSPTGSLATILKSEGYSTIAVHPYRANGWNRTEVYPNLGFDWFISRADFVEPELIRKYISDKESYRTLIQQYENKPEGQPIFLFNVTMQNHGDYGVAYDNFDEQISLPEYPNMYPGTEQYLSLLHESDEALQELIEYFSKTDEPTVICFFGDHLPNLKNDFYETVLGKELSELSSTEMLDLYQTPFLIWANYDIQEQEIDRMSANYLSTLLLQTANVELPDYNKYLSQIYPYFPVINGRTVIDANEVTYDSISLVPDREMINNYSILAYNNLFDKSGRNATLFDSACLTSTEDGIMIKGHLLSGLPQTAIRPEDLTDSDTTEETSSENITDAPYT